MTPSCPSSLSWAASSVQLAYLLNMYKQSLHDNGLDNNLDNYLDILDTFCKMCFFLINLLNNMPYAASAAVINWISAN